MQLLATRDWFDELLDVLGRFQVTRAPHSERSIETALMAYLAHEGIEATNQDSSRLGRTDILVSLKGLRVCLELKKVAYTTCVMQLDRYASAYDGLILVCYRASPSLRRVFEGAEPSAKIPIGLVEIRKNCEMV